jgi:hypothetical protein
MVVACLRLAHRTGYVQYTSAASWKRKHEEVALQTCSSDGADNGSFILPEQHLWETELMYH